MRHSQTIYVVDDDQAVRESLQWLLESVGLPARTFASAQEFLDAYQPDGGGCVVLDVRMPDMSGLEVQKRLTEMGNSLPVIIITGHGDVPMAVRALKAGAVDFIEKPFNDQTLLERIQECLEKERQRREERAYRQVLRERMRHLTQRERQVLDGVVAGKVSRAIADELGISGKTVEAHRANIIRKMGASSLAELITMCITMGLMEKGQEPPSD